MDFVQYILAETSWLYTKIYQNDFLFFDLWSIVHFWSGLVIFILLKALRIRSPFLCLFLILIAYEIAEILFIYFAFDIFRPETIKDQVTDMVVGLVGGLLSAGLLNLFERSYHRQKYVFLSGMMILAASTYAFPWVGFYHYRYGVDSFNTGGGMNFYTYIAWTLAGFFVLQVFHLFRKKSLIPRIAYTWMVYFAGLMIFEYVTYYLLGIHEISGDNNTAMVFGLVHGTTTMHVFYLLCPFLIMILNGIGVWLLERVVYIREEKVPGKIMHEIMA